MSVYHSPKITASEITPHNVFLKRRDFLAMAALSGLSILAPEKSGTAPLASTKSKYTVFDKLTPQQDGLTTRSGIPWSAQFSQ